jgi:hypothetical protein
MSMPTMRKEVKKEPANGIDREMEGIRIEYIFWINF